MRKFYIAGIVPEGVEDGGGYSVYQYIPAPGLDMIPVRLNISLSKSLVEEINDMTERMSMTRSGFITAAARAYIDRMTSGM